MEKQKSEQIFLTDDELYRRYIAGDESSGDKLMERYAD